MQPADPNDSGRLFGYARVSRAKGKVITKVPLDAPVMESELPGEVSIERQISDLKRWAEERGKPITIRYDEGISGAEVSYRVRPGFQALVKMMRRGDRLVIWRLDRLDRGLGQIIAAALWLVEQGFKVHTLYEQSGDSLDLDTMQGKILLHVYSMLATIENDYRRSATSAALQYRRRIGRRYCKNPGYGRRFETRIELDNKGKKVERTYVVWDQHQCDLIRELKDRRDKGESYYRISLDFHQRQDGKACPNGAPNGAMWLNFDSQAIAQHKQGHPKLAKKLMRWYTLLLAHGMDLGDDGVPAGVESLVKQFGVDPEVAQNCLLQTPKATLFKNMRDPKRGMLGPNLGLPSEHPIMAAPKKVTYHRCLPFRDPSLDDWYGINDPKKKKKD